MGSTITFNEKTTPPAAVAANVNTLLWHLGTLGVAMPPTEHTSGIYPQGPYDCESVQLHLNVWSDFPLDTPDTGLTNAWYPNGGSYWHILSGPYAGKYVYAWTNERNYGNITIAAANPDWTPPAEPTTPAVINPLAAWRILIKGMVGGDSVTTGLTIDDGTLLWHTGTTGVIMPPTEHATTGGTYTYESVMLPLNLYSDFPVDQANAWYPNGGSFYKITSGPYTGKYVYKWSTERGYGDISVVAPGAGTGSEARGPGATLATIYRPAAHLAGASLNYNAPGEMHFTLLVDDPNILVPKPKKTHYAIEFETSPGSDVWVEVFAGWVWDMDATDTETVFYGIDYLAALRTVIDERFDPAKPTKPVGSGGSKYVKMTIKQIIREQLYYALNLENSPIGFIKYGSIPDDLEKFRIQGIYSTFQSSLDFIIGLINSYRAGTGKFTRLEVVKVLDDERWPGGTYKFRVVGDPGESRPELGLDYGSLAQGYRIIPFGPNWGTRVHLIGRDKDGKKVTYSTQNGAALEEEWGRISTPAVIVETEDQFDLERRTAQAATDAAALGRQVGIGLKLGSYRPLEGYDICDYVPITIDHGAVDTTSWGSDPFGGELVDASGIPVSSGTWTIIGIFWESYDDGHWMTNVQLWPKNHVPYEPLLVEPDYGVVHGNTRGGGVTVVAFEITGADPDPAFAKDYELMQNGPGSYGSIHGGSGPGWTTATFPTSPTLDTTRSFLAFAGMWYNTWDDGITETDGWERDYDGMSGDDINYMFVQHLGFVPGGDNPLPATLAPVVTKAASTDSWAGILTGFYGGDPSVAPVVRQTFIEASPLLDHVGVNFELAPLAGSVLLAFIGAGQTWGSNLIRSPVLPSTTVPAENLRAHIGWTDIGVGPIYSSTAYSDYVSTGDPVYFVCEYRDAYIETQVEHPPTSSGLGPPTADTELANIYTDTATGIQYQYNWVTGEWKQLAGTGYVASGLYDFNFSAATSWIITHTLGGYPRVTLRDSTGAVINAYIHYDSTTQITVTFSSAVAGSAHLG